MKQVLKLGTLATLASALFLNGCATSITGQLKGVDGTVVSNDDARVNVTRLDETAKGDTQTSYILPVDSSGKFATSTTLPDGNYLIEALVPGFKITSVRVELNGSKEVDMTVAPLGNVKTQAIGTNVNMDMSRGSGGATLTPPAL